MWAWRTEVERQADTLLSRYCKNQCDGAATQSVFGSDPCFLLEQIKNIKIPVCELKSSNKQFKIL
jgi:hypothetical protein